jgi:glycosyltransferase involved in cell wall biosynthesis
MKPLNIYLPNNSKQSCGGGWTFLHNFTKGLDASKMKIVDCWEACDVILITGVTMTDRDEMYAAKKAGRKIVLRVDNMPKDSRNRGTAFSKMRDLALIADYIIFQSEWAQEYVGDWLRDNVNSKCMFFGFQAKRYNIHDTYVGGNSVIYNGIDTDFFRYNDDPKTRPERYLFVQYNRDENKRFTEAAMHMYKRSKLNKDVEFFILGNFSPELIEYNFDFFNGEKIVYIPPTEDREELGDIMRQCKYLLFPAYADASPNTVAEAMACGCKVLLANLEGGTFEVISKHYDKPYTIQEMANEYYEVFNKLIKK